MNALLSLSAYATLAIAIAMEVFATSMLKLSVNFTRAGPAVLTIVGYGISFYFLSLTLRTMPTGVVYAIWSGIGIVLISLISWIVFGQRLDPAAMIGMGLIIAGVVVLNLFSKAGH